MLHIKLKMNTKLPSQRVNVLGKQLLFHIIRDSDVVNRVEIKKMRGSAGLPRMIIYISLLSGLLRPP